jgi:hypothetical protein
MYGDDQEDDAVSLLNGALYPKKLVFGLICLSDLEIYVKIIPSCTRRDSSVSDRSDITRHLCVVGCTELWLQLVDFVSGRQTNESGNQGRSIHTHSYGNRYS